MTIAEHGFDSEAAERCLDAFDKLYPESGPVVTQNIQDGTLAITIAVSAPDPWEAGTLAGKIYAKSLNESALSVTQVTDVHTTIVTDREEESMSRSRQLTPA